MKVGVVEGVENSSSNSGSHSSFQFNNELLIDKLVELISVIQLIEMIGLQSNKARITFSEREIVFIRRWVQQLLH